MKKSLGNDLLSSQASPEIPEALTTDERDVGGIQPMSTLLAD